MSIYNKLIDKINYVLFIGFIFSIVSFGDNSQLYIIPNILSYVLLLLMLFRIIPNLHSVPRKAFMFFPFLVFSSMSILWSISQDASIQRTITLYKLWLLFFVITIYLAKVKKSIKYTNGIAIAALLVVTYVVNFYGISSIKQVMNTSVRLGTEIVNANTLGTFLALSTIFFLFISLEKKKWYYLAIVVIITIIVALTGSKKAIIDLIIGCIIVFLNKTDDRKPFIFRLMLGIGIACVLIFVFSELPIFNMVAERFTEMMGFKGNSIDYSTLERQRLIQAGIKQFFKRPIWGAGIGATGDITQSVVGYETYLHSNPVELLATTGLIGFLLYYIPILKLIKECYLYSKHEKKAVFILVILIISTVNSLFSVDYFSKITYVEFAIGLSYCLYKNQLERENEKNE